MLSQPREQRTRGSVEIRGISAFEQARRQRAREDLAVLDTPLVEAVQVPDDAFHEDLVLVHRDELTELTRCEPRKKEHAGRAISRQSLVRSAGHRVSERK